MGSNGIFLFELPLSTQGWNPCSQGGNELWKQDGSENYPRIREPDSLFQQDEGRGGVHTKVLARGLSVVSQIRRPVPLDEQIQELEGKNKRDLKKLEKGAGVSLEADRAPGQVELSIKKWMRALLIYLILFR